MNIETREVEQMNKLRASLIVGSILSYIKIANNPIDDAMNFIIGGSIPGTKLAIGFWPSIGLILLTVWLIKKYVSSIKLQMLEHTAKDIKAENKRKEFSENYGDSDKKLQKAILGQKDYNPSSF